MRSFTINVFLPSTKEDVKAISYALSQSTQRIALELSEKYKLNEKKEATVKKAKGFIGSLGARLIKYAE